MIKNKLYYGIIFISLCVGYIYIGDYSYFLMMLSLLFFIIAFLCINIYLSKRIDASIFLDGYSNKDSNEKDNNFVVILENKSHIPVRNVAVYIEYSDGNKNKKKIIHVPVLADSTQKIHLSLNVIHSGFIDISLKKIKLYDPFLITSFVRKINKSIKLTIIPKINKSKNELSNIEKSNIVENTNECSIKIERSSKYYSNSSEVVDFSEYNQEII